MFWKHPDPVFGFLIHDISRLLRKRFDRRARDLGLTKSQWIVMVHLARHEGIHQGGLAEILELEPATLARHLDRLGEAGWIERRPDPSDRRAWRLHLTRKAAPMLEKMSDLVEVTMGEALSGLSAQEQRQLMSSLLSIRANLTDRPAASEPGKNGTKEVPTTNAPARAARVRRRSTAAARQRSAAASGSSD